MGLGLKNQFILVKTIKFSVLVPKKLSVESSINDEKTKKRKNEKTTKRRKSTFNVRNVQSSDLCISDLLSCK